MSAMATVPNLNPTGQNAASPIVMPLPGGTSSTSSSTPYSTTWGGSPATGSPGNYNFGNSTNPNPSQQPVFNPNNPASFGPTVSMNPGAASPTNNAFNLNPADASRLSAELDKYYGQGVGAMLLNFLQSGGGFNSALTQQAVDAQIAAMQQQIQSGLGNLDTQMGETGISPNSSAWALETGDYTSNAVAQENAITAQEYFNMWNASQNRMVDVLNRVADVNATGTANEGGVMDIFKNIFSLAGDAFGAATGGLNFFNALSKGGSSNSQSSSGGGVGAGGDPLFSGIDLIG